MDNTPFLERLRNANRKRQKEWDPDQKLNVLFHALEHVCEAGELGNKVKKLYRNNIGIQGSSVDVKEIEEEIADVLITLSKLSDMLDIDLEKVTIEKFNSTSEKQGFSIKL